MSIRNLLAAFFAVGLAGGTAIAQPDPRSALTSRVGDLRAREASAPIEIKSKLAALREELQKEKKSFTIGYTTASEVPLEQLASTRIPRTLSPDDLRVALVGRQLNAIDQARFAQLRELNPRLTQQLSQTCSSTKKNWDWRKQGKVTSIKGQICGTCWDFTALGAYESSYAIRNNEIIDASEQHVLSCSKAGNCQGGWWGPVFDFLVTSGTALEKESPFTGNDAQACPANLDTPFRAASWSFVNASSWDKPPTTDEIKSALCDHGPLATAVFVSDLFQLYRDGVFDQTERTFDWINHGVVIIGWDDAKSAWLIKNSWGSGWGNTGGFGSEKGYMWIKYGSNNIGVATAWVDAARRFYRLPEQWERVLQENKIPNNKALPLPDTKLMKKMNVLKQPAI